MTTNGKIEAAIELTSKISDYNSSAGECVICFGSAGASGSIRHTRDCAYNVCWFAVRDLPLSDVIGKAKSRRGLVETQ